ncbi:MAG TPA: ABC transporter permease [bacterium]|nr:ABC transporter permease [bacterium]
MIRYIFKRILWMLPITLGVAFIVFFIVSSTPGDIPRIILGSDAPASAVEQLRLEMGLDKPILTRFALYIVGVVKGDFGTSYRSGTPVWPQIAERFPVSLKLCLCAMTFAVAIGIPLGIISAVKQYSILDNICTVVALFFAAVPPFWFGLMLIFLFALNLGWFPTGGLSTPTSYVLPTLTVGVPAAAELMRLTRTTMLESIRADFVRTARAKGISERQVVFKHALKNSLLPIITQIGMTFGVLFGATAMSETVYVIPGLGTLILNAVKSKDVPLTTGAILWLSVTFSIIMLVVDLLYAYIDPRIKAKYQNTGK